MEGEGLSRGKGLRGLGEVGVEGGELYLSKKSEGIWQGSGKGAQRMKTKGKGIRTTNSAVSQEINGRGGKEGC